MHKPVCTRRAGVLKLDAITIYFLIGVDESGSIQGNVLPLFFSGAPGASVALCPLRPFAIFRWLIPTFASSCGPFSSPRTALLFLFCPIFARGVLSRLSTAYPAHWPLPSVGAVAFLGYPDLYRGPLCQAVRAQGVVSHPRQNYSSVAKSAFAEGPRPKHTQLALRARRKSRTYKGRSPRHRPSFLFEGCSGFSRAMGDDDADSSLPDIDDLNKLSTQQPKLLNKIDGKSNATSVWCWC